MGGLGRSVWVGLGGWGVGGLGGLMGEREKKGNRGRGICLLYQFERKGIVRCDV